MFNTLYWKRLCLAIGLLILMVIPVQHPAYAAIQSRDWALTSFCKFETGRELRPGTPVSLRNLTEQKPVLYGYREYGINLVWVDDTCNYANIIFSRPNSTLSGAILYGEPVAIRELRGGYIVYKEREYGINLDYSKNPSYEWQIRGGPFGTPVMHGTAIALYNVVAQKEVVYCQREYGINLRWLPDCKAPNLPASKITLGLRFGPLSSQAPCITNVRWLLRPLQLAVGSDGTSLARETTSSYTVQPSPGADGYYCYFYQEVRGLRKGSWHVTMLIGSGSTPSIAECNVALTSDAEQVHATIPRSRSCIESVNFP